MKLTVIGVRVQSGISKKNAPYSMKQLQVLNPIDKVSNDTLQIDGKGFTSTQIDLSDQGYLDFMNSNLTYPAIVECITSAEFRNGRAVTVVSGFKHEPAKP